jgi:hypothetical protein
MKDELLRILDSVSDEESFVKFVDALANDRALAVAEEKERPSRPWGP